jgi:hypothetical protein
VADDEFVWYRSEIERLSRVVRYVEAQLRNKAPGNGRRGAFPPYMLVVLQGVMHHGKSAKTIGLPWLPDHDGIDLPAGQHVEEDGEWEIYPGPVAKGIWFKGDVVVVAPGLRTEDGLCPIAHGRQYFEATLAGGLAVDGTANVTIGGETINVKEGDFATDAIPSGQRIGVILSNNPEAIGANEYQWRAILAKCE